MKLVLSRLNKTTLFRSVIALGTIMSASCTAENTNNKATTKTAAVKSNKTAPEKKAPVTAADKTKMSIALGQKVGTQIEKSIGSDLDYKAFTNAIKGMLDGKKPTLSPEEEMASMQLFQELVQARMKKKAQENKKKGDDFLAANKKKTGIKTTKSGLQYKVVKTGKGQKPQDNEEVTVHYEGKLIDGTVFDSSITRNEPATFNVNHVIPGWTEALKLMPEGSEWELYIPSNLAYGERELPKIPANSVLHFKVSLLSIKKPEPAKKEAPKVKENKTDKK